MDAEQTSPDLNQHLRADAAAQMPLLMSELVLPSEEFNALRKKCDSDLRSFAKSRFWFTDTTDSVYEELRNRIR